jgi:hypothetical protein
MIPAALLLVLFFGGEVSFVEAAAIYMLTRHWR